MGYPEKVFRLDGMKLGTTKMKIFLLLEELI
jgi:hypothetical protein